MKTQRRILVVETASKNLGGPIMFVSCVVILPQVRCRAVLAMHHGPNEKI